MENIYDIYYKLAESEGIAAVAEPYRTIIAIDTVQAILDNGGLEYLYENSFVDGFPIDIFVQSYNNIGSQRVGDILLESYSKKRYKKVLQKYDDEIFKLSSSVWEKLNKFKESI